MSRASGLENNVAYMHTTNICLVSHARVFAFHFSVRKGNVRRDNSSFTCTKQIDKTSFAKLTTRVLVLSGCRVDFEYFTNFARKRSKKFSTAVVVGRGADKVRRS